MVRVRQAFSSFSVDDLDAAEHFYRGTLGLSVTRTDMGLQIDATGGAPVFAYPKGDAHEPASFTILNIIVPDVAATAAELAAQGVSMLRYPEFPQDEDGIAHSTDPAEGPTIAWFTDPAGNVLSLIQQ